MAAGKWNLVVWGHGCTVRRFCRFSSRAVLRVDAKEVVALTMECRRVFRSSARVDHSLWLILPALKDFFNMSLKRLFGAPLYRVIQL